MAKIHEIIQKGDFLVFDKEALMNMPCTMNQYT